MRYLKVTAQDRSGNGTADTVILHFYEQRAVGFDELIHEAVAVDQNADKKVDFQCAGDINFDGRNDIVDKYLLKAFANTFLRFNWFNNGESWRRTLVLTARRDYKKGPPNAVELAFLDRRSPMRKPTLVFQAQAYDVDGNGVLDWVSDTDVDSNGVVDKIDKELIRSLCSSYLLFKWHDPEAFGGKLVDVPAS